MQCITLVCSIVKLCVKKEQQKLFKAAGGFAIFSGRLNYSYKNQKHYLYMKTVGRHSNEPNGTTGPEIESALINSRKKSYMKFYG